MLVILSYAIDTGHRAVYGTNWPGLLLNENILIDNSYT